VKARRSRSGYLSTEHGTLLPQDRMKIVSPDRDDATMAMMRRVLRTIHADKKD
jgi:hypothetical protein